MAHINEKLDFSAEAFVVYDNKVLLKRHKKINGIWLSVGGHVELGEEPTEAVKREVKEEVGLDIEIDTRHQKFHAIEDMYRDIIPPVAVGRNRINDTHEHIVYVYFARSTTDVVTPEDPTDEWKWCTREDLEVLETRPNIKAYAKAALETLAS